MPRIRRPTRIRTTLERELRPIHDFIDDLMAFPLFARGWSEIKDESVSSGNNEIDHNLGREPVGVLVTASDAKVETPDIVSSDARTVTLDFSAAATVSLLFW